MFSRLPRRRVLHPWITSAPSYACRSLRMFTSSDSATAASAPSNNQKKEYFAISKLASEVSTTHSMQVEEILSSLDGALHLHYAKFGQSLQALYSTFEPLSTKSTTVASTDTEFPSGFCPPPTKDDQVTMVYNDDIDSSNNNNNQDNNNLTTGTMRHKDDQHGRDDIDIQNDHNLRIRLQAYRMTSCFVWLARRAGFTPITLNDQKHASKNHFLMTTPVRVLWDYFDDNILNMNGQTHYDQFYPGSTTNGDGKNDAAAAAAAGDAGGDDDAHAGATGNSDENKPPLFAKRLLMLKRGSGYTTSSGYYIMEKIDEITKRSLNNLYTTSKERLSSSLSRSTTPTAKKSLHHKISTRNIHGKNESNHSAWTKLNLNSLKILLSQIKLQDTSYDDIMMLNSPSKWRADDLQQYQKKYKYSRFFKNKRNLKPSYDLNISHFRNVPRSDLELILPNDSLKIKLRPSLIVNYGLVTVGALLLTSSLLYHGTIQNIINFDSLEIGYGSIIATSGLVAYITRGSFKYYMSKLYYKSSVTQYLSSNCISTNRASIHGLIEEARLQDFRCITIVMCALWKNQEQNQEQNQNQNKRIKSNNNDQMSIDELLICCRELMATFELNKKVIIDIERISNALLWLKNNQMIQLSRNNQMIHVYTIDEIYRKKNNMIIDSCNNNHHMWNSLGVYNKSEEEKKGEDER